MKSSHRSREGWIVAVLIGCSIMPLGPRLAAQGRSDVVSDRLEAIEKRQEQLLAEIKALQEQLADLTKRFTAVTIPPARRDAAVPTVPVPLAGSPTKGSKRAKVVLIEFSDFQCPYCGRFVNDAYRQILADYVDTGKVMLAFKHLPLVEIHPFALKAAHAAACADEQGKFWEMHDLLFADQQRLDEVSIRSRVGILRLDSAKFDACMSLSGQARVQRDLATARTLQLSATPAFIVGIPQTDGSVKPVRQISGAQPFEVFKAAIDETLLVKN